MALPRTGLSQDMPRELVEGREDVEGVEPANRTNEEFAETEATKVGSEGLRRDDAPRGGGSEEERDGQEGNSLETGLRARTLSPLEEDLVAAGGIIESKPASSNQKNNVQDAVLPLPATSRRFTTGAGPAESLHSENDPLNPSLVDKSTTWPRDSHIRIQASPSTSPVQQEQAVAGPSTIPGPAPKTPNVSPDPSPSAPTLEIPTPQAPTRLPGQAAATPQMKNQTHLDIDRAIKTTTVHFVRKQSSRPGDRNIEVVKVPTNIEDLLDNPLQPLAPLNSDSTSNLPFLRWYHLPSNNMAWVERMVKQVYAPEVMPPTLSPDEDRIARDVSRAEQMSLVERLLAPHRWTRRQYDNPEGSPGARFMNPLLSKVAKSNTTSKDLVIFMPYLHWETFSAYQKRLRSIDAALENIDFGRRRPLPEDLLSPYTTAKWKRQTALFKMKKFQTADKVIADKGKAKVTKRQRTHITKEEIEDRLVTRYYDYYGEDRVNSLNVGHNHPLLLHPLHVRRTLDRSYYYALEEAEIRKRDVDQVLYRYTYGELELYDPMMIMVDQLWLWVIDEQTAVSAFPRRWGLESKDGREKTDVQERVIQAISNEHKGIKTAEHLASIIVDKCSGVFFPEAEEEHDSVDFLDVFAVSIARLAYSQTKAFNDFCDDSRRPSKGVKKYDLQNNPLDSELRQREEHRKTCKDCGKKGVPEYWHRSQDHLHDRKCLALPDQPDYQTHATAMNSEGGRHAPRKQKSLVDISQETEYVKEIKDILDEMNSMARVFEQQIELLKSQRTTDNDDLYDADAAYTLHDVYGKVKERLARITQLQREAERVYSALRDLLDLKQKQASVKQTDDTAQQGLTILVFTIITIIFSPLSFIAAIFSMNAREINNTELRPLSKIWRIMFPVTVGVLALSLLLAFSVNPFAKGFEKLVDQWRVLQGTWHQRLRKYKFHPKNWFSSSGRGGNDRKGSDKEPLQVEEKEAEAEEHSAKKERTVILPLPKQSRMKLEKEKDTGGKKAEPETNIEESGMSGALQPEDTQKRFSLFRRQKKTDSKV